MLSGLFAVSTTYAQNNFAQTISMLENSEHDCGTMHAHNHRLQNEFNAHNNFEALEVDYQNKMIQKTLFPDFYNLMQNHQNYLSDPDQSENYLSSDTPYFLMEDQPVVLPMVFHIFSTESSVLLTDDEIQLNVDWLNQHLANQAGSYYYRMDGTNTGIQVALANTDPNGNPTNGINRFSVSNSTVGTSGINNFASSTISWNTTQYINVWVVDTINGAAAYAYLPSGTNPPYYDGIYIQANYLNAWNENNPNQTLPAQTNSVILTHELGHYLGLYHTFHNRFFIQGCQISSPAYACYSQSNNNCLVNGDRICDTPPDAWNSTSCSVLHNTANTDADDTSINNPFATDVPDIQGNVMDYGSNACLKQLTQGQSARMNYVTQNQRVSLLTSPGLSGVNNPTCERNVPSISLTSSLEILSGDSTQLTAIITNNNQYCGNSIVSIEVASSTHSALNVVLASEMLNLADGQSVQVPLQIDAPDQFGIYDAVLSIKEVVSGSQHNHTITVTVEQPMTSAATNPEQPLSGEFSKINGSGLANDNSLKSALTSGQMTGCQSTQSNALFWLLTPLGLFIFSQRKSIS